MRIVFAAIMIASATAASAQSYEITRPYGNDGPAIVTGPNGYSGQLSSPYGRNGPSYYSDNSNTLRPPPDPLAPNPYMPRRNPPCWRGLGC